jgi:pimeloyl-ACP methyl ester carboxylesterase
VDGERVVRVRGVALCVDSVGTPGDPPVVLIAGSSGSMDWWDDEFCARIAAGGRFVVRYDHRDTGRSAASPVGAPDYSLADLADDVLRVLDAFELRRAHLVGISMGGFLVQHLAVHQPARVSSLALLATSPGGPGPDLPPIDPALLASFDEPRPDTDWSDRASVVARLVADQRRYAGTLPVDEDEVRRLANRVFDRTADLAASFTNHGVMAGAPPVRARLGEVSAPTLVAHGTADPLFPFGHAEALAREIPNAELLPLPGVGHQMPPRPVWDVLVPALLRHTAAR